MAINCTSHGFTRAVVAETETYSIEHLPSERLKMWGLTWAARCKRLLPGMQRKTFVTNQSWPVTFHCLPQTTTHSSNGFGCWRFAHHSPGLARECQSRVNCICQRQSPWPWLFVVAAPYCLSFTLIYYIHLSCWNLLYSVRVQAGVAGRGENKIKSMHF